jgi:hypothetical protein
MKDCAARRQCSCYLELFREPLLEGDLVVHIRTSLVVSGLQVVFPKLALMTGKKDPPFGNFILSVGYLVSVNAECDCCCR